MYFITNEQKCSTFVLLLNDKELGSKEFSLIETILNYILTTFGSLNKSKNDLPLRKTETHRLT